MARWRSNFLRLRLGDIATRMPDKNQTIASFSFIFTMDAAVFHHLNSHHPLLNTTQDQSPQTRSVPFSSQQANPRLCGCWLWGATTFSLFRERTEAGSFCVRYFLSLPVRQGNPQYKSNRCDIFVDLPHCFHVFLEVDQGLLQSWHLCSHRTTRRLFSTAVLVPRMHVLFAMLYKNIGRVCFKWQ